MNKKKIINDPVYGFISIQHETVYDVLAHPYFQRLRNIKQLGLTHLVYPGALHTRFHHALGALHLMNLAIDTLRLKDIEISNEEAVAVSLAILLHDVGHGPFSHALEHSLVEGISHEYISSLIMQKLNAEMEGKLNLSIAIYTNIHSKKYLHQLVSGQLDLDRMDYLNRDSFFTGVSEGVISFDRIIKMLNVVDNKLVIEEKGIYSIEKFIVARRLMYWQVYYHKTVIAAEQLLIKILKRAKELALSGADLFATPALQLFLSKTITKEIFIADGKYLEAFSKLDDHDIMASIKVWANHEDTILSRLCSGLISRNLYKVDIRNTPVSANELAKIQDEKCIKFNVDKSSLHYFAFSGEISNNAYNDQKENIEILEKSGKVTDITQVSDNYNLTRLIKPVHKYFLCSLP